MLEARAAEMSDAISLPGISKKEAEREVRASIERIVHYAGWTDKYQALLGSVNPVSSPHFNFTVTEPMGIIGIVAPDEAPLLGLLSLVLPAITGGNTVVTLASATQPYPSILLGEMLATSDLPGGVVNLLTGRRDELIPTFATHAHLRGLAAVANLEERKILQTGAAESVKRLKLIPAEIPTDWFAEKAQGLYEIRDHLEAKTTWHPVGA
jgi:aldehyde dehydrogenase (NAD+)